MNALLLSMLLLQASGPLARTRVEPADGVTVGQPISVIVDVLVPSYFMGAPRFPDVDVADALVVFEPRGANFTERIGGETFAGQTRRYTIYPQRAGDYEIPAIPVTVRYFSGGGPADATVSPPPVRFAARIPPEAVDLGYFIATTDFALGEEVVPDTRELAVGEALSRTVTMTVNGALSMVIPPLAFAPIPGLAVYPEPPVVNDSSSERGREIVGTRIEKVSYVAEEPGHYQLPEIRLMWWDVQTKRMRSASAAAIDLNVVANPELSSEFALPPEPASEEGGDEATRVSLGDVVRRFVGPIAAVVLLAFGVRWLSGVVRSRVEPVETEATYFGHFRRAARSADPRATARSLMLWLDRRRDQSPPALFRDFRCEAADPLLDREAEALDEILYADSREAAGWSGVELYRRVDVARRKHRHTKASGDELPPLNPKTP